MKGIVVGLGTQGKKREKILKKKKSFYCSVDPYSKKADFKNIKEIPDQSYDTVFICTPDHLKEKYIDYFLKRKKNIFVEKPLLLNKNKIYKIKKIIEKNNCNLIVGYNHRFEPHFIKLKKLIKEKKIGKLYYLDIFYGNGTSKLVSNSWRNKNLDIFFDIGSHIFDLLIEWFGIKKIKKFNILKSKLENKFYDHLLVFLELDNNIKVNIEITYCSWKNTFRLNLIGKNGSININNLCKWGPSEIKVYKRKYPSGVPKIIFQKVLKIKDPTWEREFFFLKKKISNSSGFDAARQNQLNYLMEKINK